MRCELVHGPARVRQRLASLSLSGEREGPHGNRGYEGSSATRTLDRQRRRRPRAIGTLRRVVLLVGDVLPGFEDAPLMTARVTFKRAIRVPALDDVLDSNQADRRAARAGGLVGHGRDGIPSEAG